jgi:hypothetical protein
MPLDHATGVVHWTRPVSSAFNGVQSHAHKVHETKLELSAVEEKRRRVADHVSRVTGLRTDELTIVLYVLSAQDASDPTHVSDGCSNRGSNGGGGTPCPESQKVIMACRLKGLSPTVRYVQSNKLLTEKSVTTNGAPWLRDQGEDELNL